MLFSKAGGLFGLRFREAYFIFSYLRVASISFRSMPGRKATFAPLIIEALKWFSVAASSLIGILLENTKVSKKRSRWFQISKVMVLDFEADGFALRWATKSKTTGNRFQNDGQQNSEFQGRDFGKNH